MAADLGIDWEEAPDGWYCTHLECYVGVGSRVSAKWRPVPHLVDGILKRVAEPGDGINGGLLLARCERHSPFATTMYLFNEGE